MAENGVQGGSNHPSDGGNNAAPPTDLVQRVADEVYRLFLHDLKLERERRGEHGPPAHKYHRLSNHRG